MLPFFNTHFPAFGWVLLYLFLTCSCINSCCQQKLEHRLDDSDAMLSVMIRLVPIHFVAGFFILVCFARFCNRFVLLHFSQTKYKYIIWCSFHLAAFFQEVVSCLGFSCCVSSQRVYLSTAVANTDLRSEWMILLKSFFFVVIRRVPIHIVAVFFMLVCFARFCNRFILLHYS